MMKITLLALVGLACIAPGLAKHQSYWIKGKFFCMGRPMVNIKVKLKQDEMGRDDNLAVGRTNSQGYVELKGSVDKFTPGTIKTYFKAYHKCNRSAVRRFRVFKMNLPKSMTDTNKAFDFMEVELGLEQDDEERSLTNVGR